MYEFKNALKSNRFVLISLGVFFAASEILLGIINFREYGGDLSCFRFTGNIVLRLFMLVVGICLAYIVSYTLEFDFFPQFLAPAFTVISVLCSYSGLGYAIDTNQKNYMFCSVAALISLALYYISRCSDSLLHTLFYILQTTVLALGTFDEIEIFIVLSAHILLFIYNRKNFSVKSVKIVNYIFTALAVAALVACFVRQMNDYIGMRYFEGETIFYIEKMLFYSPLFGKSEFYYDIIDKRAEYNLAKIFGSYGYVVGTATVLIIAAFVAGICYKCIKNKGKMKPALIAVSTIFVVRCTAALFVNFGVITGTSSCMPLLSQGSFGYFIVGLLAGITIAASRNNFSQEDFENGKYILYSAVL